MSATTDVVSAGILVADIFPNTLKRFPDPGELLPLERFVIQPGGCAANTGIGLARLGVSTAAVGKVGTDIFGDFVLGVLEDAGVDIASVVRSTSAETSKTIVLTLEGEDRRFLHLIGANGEFSAADIPPGVLDGARVCYVGGFLGMAAFTATDLASFFASARKRGIVTMLDVIIPGQADYTPIFAEVLPYVDYFLPNSDEGRAITGETDPMRQAQIFREMGARTAVITCGDDGVIALSEESTVSCGRYSVDFVDGSGAGDAFDAGFITGLLESRPLTECVVLGSAMGASCVREIGCTTGLFNREELDAFVESHSVELKTT